jgi:exopolyphosphatase/guanosine-5'-triphosphate,3'-diphosphate pyrophosphatase
MIRWGRIPGLESWQREVVALLARCHRKPTADARRLFADAPLSKERRGQAKKLCALLRLADGLDCEHRQRVEHIVCARVGDAIVLDLVVRDGPTRDDANLLRKAEMFREELELDVRITVGRTPAAKIDENKAVASS